MPPPPPFFHPHLLISFCPFSIPGSTSLCQTHPCLPTPLLNVSDCVISLSSLLYLCHLSLLSLSVLTLSSPGVSLTLFILSFNSCFRLSPFFFSHFLSLSLRLSPPLSLSLSLSPSQFLPLSASQLFRPCLSPPSFSFFITHYHST